MLTVGLTAVKRAVADEVDDEDVAPEEKKDEEASNGDCRLESAVLLGFMEIPATQVQHRLGCGLVNIHLMQKLLAKLVCIGMV